VTRKPCQMETHVWYNWSDSTLHAEIAQTGSQDTGTFVSQMEANGNVHLHLGFKKSNKFRVRFNSGGSKLSKDWDLTSGSASSWIFWSLKIENANSVNKADVTLYSSLPGSVVSSSGSYTTSTESTTGSAATTYASSPPMYKSETTRHNKYYGRGDFQFGTSPRSNLCNNNKPGVAGGVPCGCTHSCNYYYSNNCYCTGTSSDIPGSFTYAIEMDDFYLFNDRALSSAEIYAIRTGGTVSHANLVMLFRFHFQEAWPMNGYGQNNRQLAPSTLTVTDLSGEDRHGTATGWYIKVRTRARSQPKGDACVLRRRLAVYPNLVPDLVLSRP